MRVTSQRGRTSTLIRTLGVRAPRGATVKVKCIGRGCPKRGASSTRSKGKVMRVKWLEHRLRAGTRITISITRKGYIGSYTSLVVRRSKGIARNDLCLLPNRKKPGGVPVVRMRTAALSGLVAVLLLIPAASASAADPTGDFDISPNVPLVGQDVTFTPKALADPEILPILGGIKSVKFDFGDGSEITDSDAPFEAKTHAYGSPGTRTVVMTITDIADDTTTVDHNVRVNSRPTARFSFSPETPNVGARVTLNAGGVHGQSHHPERRLRLGPGRRRPVRRRRGRDHQRHLPDARRQDGPPAGDGLRRRDRQHRARDPREPAAGGRVRLRRPPPRSPARAVEFTSVSRDPDGPVSAEVWDLDGDGQYDDAQGKTASITYKLAGTKTVRLRVTDAQGRTDVRAGELLRRRRQRLRRSRSSAPAR